MAKTAQNHQRKMPTGRKKHYLALELASNQNLLISESLMGATNGSYQITFHCKTFLMSYGVGSGGKASVAA